MENEQKKSLFKNLPISLISEICKFLPREELHKIIELLEESIGKLLEFDRNLDALEKLIKVYASNESNFISKNRSLSEKYHNFKEKIINDSFTKR